MQSNALSAAGLVGPCLEKIIEATPARRKEFVNLRHDAKACRACSEPLACPTFYTHITHRCSIYGVLCMLHCHGMQCSGTPACLSPSNDLWPACSQSSCFKCASSFTQHLRIPFGMRKRVACASAVSCASPHRRCSTIWRRSSLVLPLGERTHPRHRHRQSLRRLRSRLTCRRPTLCRRSQGPQQMQRGFPQPREKLAGSPRGSLLGRAGAPGRRKGQPQAAWRASRQTRCLWRRRRARRAAVTRTPAAAALEPPAPAGRWGSVWGHLPCVAACRPDRQVGAAVHALGCAPAPQPVFKYARPLACRMQHERLSPQVTLKVLCDNRVMGRLGRVQQMRRWSTRVLCRWRPHRVRRPSCMLLCFGHAAVRCDAVSSRPAYHTGGPAVHLLEGIPQEQ